MADAREYFTDTEEALKAMLDGHQAQVWTSFPGIIEEFDPDQITASVQPAIQARIQAMDGTFSFQNMPLLQDVPVMFSRGGPFELTFPVQSGDECEVWISRQCIDSWWQSGGVQPPAHPRMHDLSDGFCLVGPVSQPKVKAPVSISNVQLRVNGSPILDISETTFTFTGNIMVTGGIISTQDVVAGPNTISLMNHEHTSAAPGSPTSPPIAGT